MRSSARAWGLACFGATLVLDRPVRRARLDGARGGCPPRPSRASAPLAVLLDRPGDPVRERAPARRGVDGDRLAPRPVAARRVHLGPPSGRRRSATAGSCRSPRSPACGASRSSWSSATRSSPRRCSGGGGERCGSASSSRRAASWWRPSLLPSREAERAAGVESRSCRSTSGVPDDIVAGRRGPARRAADDRPRPDAGRRGGPSRPRRVGRGRAGPRRARRPRDDRRGPDGRSRRSGCRRSPARSSTIPTARSTRARSPSTGPGRSRIATTRRTSCRSASTSPGAPASGGSARSRRSPSTGCRGSGSTPSPSRALPPFGTPICFENAFPAIPRALVRDGAGVPRGAGEQRVVRLHRRSGPAPADEPAARGGDRALGRRRGGRGGERLRRSDGPVVQRTEPVRHDDPPGRGRVVDAADALRASRGLGARRVARPGRDRVPDAATSPQVAGHPQPRWVVPVRALAILPTYEERDTIEQVLRGVLTHARRGRARRRRLLARRDRGHRARDRGRPSRASGCGPVRRNRGSRAPTSKGSRSRWRRATTSSSRWTPTSPTTPSELPVLLAAADAHDLAVGSRYVPGGSVTNWSRARVLLSRAGNTYARFMLGLPIHDATSGYRVYRRAAPGGAPARAVRRRGLRLPDRARVAGPSARVPTSAKRRSRSGNGSSAAPRSPARSSSRRCGWSPGGGSSSGSGPRPPSERWRHRDRRNADNAYYVTLSGIGSPFSCLPGSPSVPCSHTVVVASRRPGCEGTRGDDRDRCRSSVIVRPMA